MVTLDLTPINALLPVFGFLLVFVVTYALLSTTKLLGENKFVHILTSFVIAIIFLVSANAIEYVRIVTPWAAVFLVSLLLIGLVVGLMGKKNLESVFNPKFAWFIVIALLLVFVISGIYLFANVFNQHLAGPKAFFSQPQVFTVVILLGLTIFASWLLTKK